MQNIGKKTKEPILIKILNYQNEKTNERANKQNNTEEVMGPIW